MCVCVKRMSSYSCLPVCVKCMSSHSCLGHFSRVTFCEMFFMLLVSAIFGGYVCGHVCVHLCVCRCMCVCLGGRLYCYSQGVLIKA